LGAAYPAFHQRHLVPPGITGLVQVTGATGAEYTARLDAFYARTWSVQRDIYILARTVWINLVGKRRGAMARPEPSL
jgi:lipopolysaccharide/colanic/teichoic acid biosynthesis glycosyltransferase